MEEIEEENEDNLNNDNSNSLKNNFQEKTINFEYEKYKYNFSISKDNNYIRIICSPKSKNTELYEYIMDTKEFAEIFDEKENKGKTLEDYFIKIKNSIKDKKIIVNYDSNLYNLSFNIYIKNEVELKFKKNICDISKKIFKKIPILKFKETIISTNCGGGCNSTFDVFLCYKDSKQYLASSNYINYNIDIISLEDNQLTTSLKGHNNEIYSIRYFINDYNKDEYLISSDSYKKVIVWNILKNYKIDFSIEEDYSKFRHIYSCMITNIEEFNYVIISSYTPDRNYINIDSKKDCTKMYSLMNRGFIKNIYNTYNNCTRYLLSWHNDDNYNDYIIECCDGKISINNLLKKENYCDFESDREGEEFLSGFIFSKNNIDYLCTASWNGYIRIWDLYEKIEINFLKTQYCELYFIIPWSDKHIIIANKFIKSINVVDIETLETITIIKNENLNGIKCIKKIIHPLYGESLLACSENGSIYLFVLYNKI